MGDASGSPLALLFSPTAIPTGKGGRALAYLRNGVELTAKVTEGPAPWV